MTKGPTQDNSFFRTVPGAAQCHKRLSHGLVAARPKLPKAEKMKIAICIAALTSIVTVGALAQTAPLTYLDIVKEARRYDNLELSERVVSNKILGQKVRLNLQKFGNGSPNFYVKRSDMIAFVCDKSAPNFKGGNVTATITLHEEAEGGHFYTLDNCTTAK